MNPGLQYYDIALSAGAQRNIGAPGRYFRYYSGSAAGADESIIVKTDTGALYCILKPGQSIKLPESANEWKITAKTASSVITGIVIIGDGKLTDSQVAGTVNVVDGGKARTSSNTAFVGNGYSAVLAGNYSHVQLWNPAGTGKNLFVEQVGSFSNTAAYLAAVRGHNAALTTLVGNPVSKKISGTASTAEIRTQQNAAIIPAGMSVFSASQYSPTIKFSEPIMLPPGQGLVIFGNNVVQDVGGNFEFFEEAV